MIRRIAPQFFTIDIPATLAYYKDKLGFECVGTWQDPPVYAIVARDRQAIHFRCAEPPAASPDKYADELLDATYPSKTRTRCMQSMQPKAWNSLENLPTCHGIRASLC
jgi:catechol 2,3-dioxygenase-like lactoylglutathione lyase family enzyme